MGLQNQLSDVSSESILILLVVLIAKGVRYLRCLLSTILQSLGLITPQFEDPPRFDDSIYDAVGTRLASLTLLCEQLNLNRLCSYTNRQDRSGSDCVVCLNQLDEGDHVRELPCLHVFHKECFDGWLDNLNFNCPLCRAPLVPEERMESTKRRVAEGFLAWSPFQ